MIAAGMYQSDGVSGGFNTSLIDRRYDRLQTVGKLLEGREESEEGDLRGGAEKMVKRRS
jgi:hypothetical protein